MASFFPGVSLGQRVDVVVVESGVWHLSVNAGTEPKTLDAPCLGTGDANDIDGAWFSKALLRTELTYSTASIMR